MDSNISLKSSRLMKDRSSRKSGQDKQQQKDILHRNGNSNGNNNCGTSSTNQLITAGDNNVEEESDLEEEVPSPTTIKHNTITSLTALKQMLRAYGDSTNPSFFQNYFQNHTNSLPSRSVVNCRRLSQCREEDEEEDKKDQHVPSSDLTTISGSDKSLSESSSGGSKSSVIDTVTGPTHKFVITKTKQPSEAATNFARNSRKYQQANTVHFPTDSKSNRPSVYSIFGKSSAITSPHYDRKFFDSSLIEMKSQTSSSSTIDCDGAEDIWVKRTPAQKKVKLFLNCFFVIRRLNDILYKCF